MSTRLIAITVLMLATSAFAGNKIKGEVEEIISGDKIIVETKKGDVKVKLYGIDAPEENHEYGRKSRNLLRDLIDDEDVKIEVVAVKNSGTLIGKVYFDGDYINEEMLKAGAAWYNSDKAEDRKLKKAEKLAREKERGLWKHNNPTPPLIFIKNNTHKSRKFCDSNKFSLKINIIDDDHDPHHSKRAAHRDRRH